jgi:hypothetical protein
MRSRCKKLARAYGLLIEMLSRGPVLIAVCIARAASIGVGQRCLYRARSLLPIEVKRIPYRDGGTYWWLAGLPASDPPARWRPLAPVPVCIGCGIELPDRCGNVRRCRVCKLKFNAMRARQRAAARGHW